LGFAQPQWPPNPEVGEVQWSAPPGLDNQRHTSLSNPSLVDRQKSSDISKMNLLLSVVLLSLCATVLSLPIPARQPPYQQLPLRANSAANPCTPSESVDTYTAEWFLNCTLPQYRHEIHGNALFYTKGASEVAQKLGCSKKSEYVTLWQICTFGSFPRTGGQH
jgi:hypothetical protein